MMRWLARHEKVAFFQLSLDMRTGHKEKELSQILKTRQGQPIALAKHCPYPRQAIEIVQERHCAKWFSWYLKEFLYNNSLLGTHPIARGDSVIQNLPLPFQSVDIWTNACLCHKDIQGLDADKKTMDSFHASPLHKHLNGKEVPARFDTVLVDEYLEDPGMERTSVEGEYALKYVESLAQAKARYKGRESENYLHSPKCIHKLKPQSS